MVGGVALVVVVVGLGLLNDVLLEEGGVFGQILVREAGADLTDALILLVVRVVASQQEPSVPAEKILLILSRRLAA